MVEIESHKKTQQSLAVANLYYKANMSQEEIAKKLAISRPTVSRLLQYAKEIGIVRIEIVDPYASAQALEALIQQKYDLPEVHVVYTDASDYQQTIVQLGQYAADYLTSIVKDNDLIGVSWGKTLNQVALALKEQTAQNANIIELKGSVTYTPTPVYAEEVLMKFGAAFHTAPHVLPLPVVFGNQTTHDVVMEDRHIRRMIEMGKQANIAIYTVGTVRDEALLFQTGYFNKEEQTVLQQKAVGDICSRFYNTSGQVTCAAIDQRTVGIQLADLKTKEHSILVAGGQQKIAAIKGALAGHYANCLIIDVYTAQALIAPD